MGKSPAVWGMFGMPMTARRKVISCDTNAPPVLTRAYGRERVEKGTT